MEKLNQIPDSLYALAFQYKQTKLWKKLWDTQLFAVRHGDGTIGYCCVMGRGGEHCALALYHGAEGLASYCGLGSLADSVDEFEFRERTLAQDCISLSFECRDQVHPRSVEEVQSYCKRNGIVLRGANAYPCFERYQPNCHPWRIVNPTDLQYLQEAIYAAMEVAERLQTARPAQLGFTEGAPFDRSIPLLSKESGGYQWSMLPLPQQSEFVYPKCEITDDITFAKLRRAKKNSHCWAIRIFMHVAAVTQGETAPDGMPIDAPRYPYLMMILDETTQMVLTIGIEKNLGDYTADFRQALVDAVAEHGRPAAIHVVDARTECFLSELMEKLGWRLKRQSENEALKSALCDFAEEFDDSFEEDGEQEHLEELCAALRSMKDLRQLPDEVFFNIFSMMRGEELPDDVASMLWEEFRRRALQ